MTLTDTASAISLPGSEAGLSQPDMLDGLMIGTCGPEAAHASRSAMLEKDWQKKMRGICGLSSDASLRSATLQSSLENRLRANLGAAGSPEFEVIWKHWDMESGPPICALRASARRISGNGFIGSPTPATQNASGGAKSDADKGTHFTLQTAARYMGIPTPKTPTGGAESVERKKELGRMGAGGGDLQAVVQMFAGTPTPTSLSFAESHRPGNNRQMNKTLEVFARDWKDGDCSKANVPVNALLGRQVHGMSSTPSSAGTSTSAPDFPRSGVLDAAFSRWLMAFPREWDRLSPGWSCWALIQKLLGGLSVSPGEIESAVCAATETR